MNSPMLRVGAPAFWAVSSIAQDWPFSATKMLLKSCSQINSAIPRLDFASRLRFLWRAVMSVCVESHPPEIAGRVAANNRFALVKAACTPASRLMRAAWLWLVAVICLTAAAAGITAAEGFFPIGIEHLTASVESVSPVSALFPVPKGSAPITTATVQTVVLRGQPPSRAGRHL